MPLIFPPGTHIIPLPGGASTMIFVEPGDSISQTISYNVGLDHYTGTITIDEHGVVTVNVKKVA